jgi:hypothetical protein
MNSNKGVDCPNCGVSFNPEDKFCTNCGQKASLPGLSLISLIKEYIDIVFNFEYRLWISFLHLFIPGKLSTQFFAGKRQKYLSPLRIFLISGLIHFALFGHWVNNKFDKQLSSFENYIQVNAFREQFISNIDSLPNNIFTIEGLDTTQAFAIKEKIIQRLKFKSAPSDSLFNKFNEDEPISISQTRNEVTERNQKFHLFCNEPINMDGYLFDAGYILISANNIFQIALLLCSPSDP